MKKHFVYITQIRPTANDTHQLMLSQIVEKELNAVQFFMKGHPNFTEPKARVCFTTVSKEQMERFNFKEGDNLNEKTKVDWNIEVIEGFSPFGKRRNPDTQELEDQLPKMNPLTKQILMKGSKPIYRMSRLIRGVANDIMIQHDAFNVAQSLPEAVSADSDILKH